MPIKWKSGITRNIVKFQVYNPTNVEGVISVNVEEAVCSEVRGKRTSSPSRRKIILSNEYKRFVYSMWRTSRVISRLTRTSRKNLRTIMQNFAKWQLRRPTRLQAYSTQMPPFSRLTRKRCGRQWRSRIQGLSGIQSEEQTTIFLQEESEDKYKTWISGCP